MKLFIHHLDLDGLSCFLLANYFKEEIGITDFIVTDYKEFEDEENSFPWEELEKPWEEIIYADITPSKKARELIKKSNNKCLILDHHEKVKSEIDAWEYDNFTYIYDVDRSGAKLVFDHLIKEKEIKFSEIIQEFTDIVCVYDLYQKKSPLWDKADALNRLLYQTAKWSETGVLEKYNFFINTIIWKFNNSSKLTFSKLEESKILQSRAKEDEIFKEFEKGKRDIKTRRDEQGNYFSIIKLNSKVSSIASRLLERYSKLSYLIIINEYNKENPKISLRAREGFNLLEFEKATGHQGACALEDINIEFINNLWNGKIFSLKKRLTEE